MKKLILLCPVLMGITFTALGQAPHQDGEALIAPSLVMRVIDGKVKLFRSNEEQQDNGVSQQHRLVYDSDLSEAVGGDPIYRLTDEDKGNPEPEIHLSDWGANGDTQVFSTTEYRTVPGSQGSVAIRPPLTKEEERDIIDTMADYASAQALAAAEAFCKSKSAMKPAAIGIVANAMAIQVHVTWSVDQACAVEQNSD